MEPATIIATATAAIKLLGPYFKEAASGAFKKAGEETGKSAISSAFAKAHNVYELVKSNFQHKPEASQALAKLEVAPEDKAAQNVIETQLKQVIEEDHGFGDQLAQLLKEVAATKADVSFVNNIQGEVQKLVQIGTVIGDVNL
jgi:hypothetical protein